jgi:2-polyprenyl-3-methyl-5-hydroxy-6-metoxy-1,4-benzoquinol methylase
MSNNTAKNLTQEYWDNLLSNNTSLKGVGWPNWPESYNRILYRKYLKGFEDVVNELRVTHNLFLEDIRILEIGPGSGFYTRYMRQAGAKNYVGADISEASVSKLAQEFPEFEFIRKNISDPDEFVNDHEEYFDLICIIDVLLHITDEEKFVAALDNISKMLKPGGFLVIGDAISVYSKVNHSEGSKYTTDVSRHIDHLKLQLKSSNIELLKVFQRHNFLMNKNFDFKYPVFNSLGKPLFYLLNGGLSFFRNNDLVGKLVGYPLSFLDSLITPFQKYSKNSKFLLFKKKN